MYSRSNRKGNLPPVDTTHTPPSGLWHNFYTSDNQGWSGYTTDINTQSPYFGAAAANHAETELAMIDLHDQFIPLGRRISALAYNCTIVDLSTPPDTVTPDILLCNLPVSLRVRVQSIRHFKTCKTYIYLHNECAHFG